MNIEDDEEKDAADGDEVDGESNVENQRTEKRRLIAVFPLKDDSRVSLFLSCSQVFIVRSRRQRHESSETP